MNRNPNLVNWALVDEGFYTIQPAPVLSPRPPRPHGPGPKRFLTWSEMIAQYWLCTVLYRRKTLSVLALRGLWCLRLNRLCLYAACSGSGHTRRGFARGRSWSGRSALGLGLDSGLGGFGSVGQGKLLV